MFFTEGQGPPHSGSDSVSVVQTGQKAELLGCFVFDGRQRGGRHSRGWRRTAQINRNIQRRKEDLLSITGDASVPNEPV